MEAKTCPACGAQFECGAREGKCWCADLPHSAPYPADNSDCLCPNCLKHKIEVLEGYNAVAQTYADKYGDEILLKPKVQQFIGEFVREIPAQGLICDIGCGPGQVA